MKKILFPSFLLLTFVASAQLNNRFYSVGYATNVSAICAYGVNSFLDWRQVQKYPASAYNWSYADGLIQANQSAGLHTILTLRCVHPINTDDSTAGTCAYQFDNGTNDDNSNWPVVGSDTTSWKNFVHALVDRYDGDGTNDMPGLIYPVRQWHIIGQEYPRVWCSQYPDTSLASAQEFVKLVNMTYNVIKTKQPGDTISFAGIDGGNQIEAFYDGYFPNNQTTICVNPNCTTPMDLTQAQISSIPSVMSKRRNVMYIFKNALTDEIDLHEYGRWQNIPDIVKWAKDSTFGKPVMFMEGGGPFCKACENLYHSVNDNDGRLPAPLVRDNSSYVVYYFITGLANGVKKLHWHLFQEYTGWGTVFGDLDLLSINNVPKPSAYTYRFLAKTIFSRADADTVIKITEANPNLYHYQINPLAMNVIWSTNATDSFLVSGTGALYRWDIPTTCNSLYPTYCDSVVQQDSMNVSGSYTIHLYDGVPVFYSWNNVLIGITHIVDSIKVQAGWNLLSVPAKTPDSSKITLFPTAISNAFKYTGSYQVEDTLKSGVGYWLKFDTAQTVIILGDSLHTDTICVKVGWNLIGTITDSIPVSSIKQIPGNIIESNFFKYSNSYDIVDTLSPGKGYWVKVNQIGRLILSK